MSKHGRALLALALLSGCAPEAPPFDPNEWLPGGGGTNRLLLGGNAFGLPMPLLTPEHEQDFFSGNGFFNQAWVEAPASTANRDGLGPLFNARTCSGCHFRDGKGFPPDDGQPPFVGLLIRLSVPGEHGPVADPVYGGQLQDQALPGVPVEALPVITWTDVPGAFDDGTAYTLRAPTYTLTEPAYGPLPGELMLSPRVAPHMIGLGLLESIPVGRLQDLADPDDADGDGISGRLQWHDTPDGPLVGRFGWKADAPAIRDQTAGAFAGDMGLTSPAASVDDCTDEQWECLERTSGGEPEVEPHIFDKVVLYSRTLAVPARRNAEDPTVMAGRDLFYEAGCHSCHTPSHTTGEGPLPELADQLIWPYTDLLLHDMGEALADHRPVGEASGSEWKTPPLWGLGLVDEVGGAKAFLHDGRARTLQEAILWHGGEAQDAADTFRAMSATEREALITFLEDL